MFRVFLFIFNDGKSIQSIILSLRATENESLWISASMIVPIAKIFLDNERIIFYEKFQKTYVDQDISQLMRLAGIKKPVKLIQNLLFGNFSTRTTKVIPTFYIIFINN